MATRKSSQSSATATAVTTSSNAEAQDDAVATSAASTPSGTNGPDGTNSTDTPPSSGDAAEEASTNSVNAQTNAENAETTTVEAANGTSTPETEASVSGTSSNASQGEADGAGANAGSDQVDFSMGVILDAIAASSSKDVAALMVLGRNVILAIDDVAKADPDLARWLTDENPAGIIRELSDQVGYLGELLEDRTSPKDAVEKRRFLITKNLNLNNVFYEESDGVWLTFDEHALAFAANACEPDWHNGGTLPR